MSKTPDVRPIDVQYKDGEPKRITVETVRWEGDNRYTVEHRFNMEGSTAVLTMFVTGTQGYNWSANEDTRKAATEAVKELPIVQAVAMPGVDG